MARGISLAKQPIKSRETFADRVKQGLSIINSCEAMAATTTYDFSNKHAIVTGGAAGIGLACVERLLGAGACVTIWDRDTDAIERINRRQATGLQAIQTDVSDEASIESALKQTLATNTKVDVLVNSAGITGPNMPVADYPTEQWCKVFAINTLGTFLTCKHVTRVMQSANGGAGYGRIVNIASVAGKEGNPNASAYSASKAAVIALTKSLGKELALTGIRVNCITPAAVRTALFDQMSEEHIDFMLSKIPMNRFGLVQELANLVIWLSSDECNFSTGAAFDISGGRATY